MKELIYGNGQVVGSIEDYVYTTERDPEKHFFKKLQGYPISSSTLETLKNKGVEKIIIIEYGKTGLRFFSGTLTQYLNGQSIRYAGYDEQKIVPLNDLWLEREDLRD